MDFKLSKPGQTSMLPQYLHSDIIYERFLDAIQSDFDEIERAINVKGTKFTDLSETIYDNLVFFTKNKLKFEDEFFNELSDRINEEKADLFCKTISQNWFDGRAKRNSIPVKELMASIKQYLINRKAKDETGIKVIYEIGNEIKPSFSDEEIAEIITLNKQMLDGYLDQWIEGHPNRLEMSIGDIYCRRGIFLDKLLDTEEYLEWNYINSYSLAFTVTEKFSQMGEGKEPAIINTNYSNIRERVLFFSPFIREMPPIQFELGIIPHWWTMSIVNQGYHGQILEYLVD